MSTHFNHLTGTFEEDEPQPARITRPCGCTRPQWFSDGSPAAGDYQNRVEHRTCRRHGRKKVADRLGTMDNRPMQPREARGL